MPGYELRIVGDDGRECGAGEIGELQISGPSAALMYWNNRAKTKATFAGEWTRSGDKYTRDADGYYTYGGRSDDMLKVGGIYVSPFEVEACLMTHAAVLEAAVIGVADSDELVKPKAYVVLEARPAGQRGRPAGAREEPAGALQVPALDRVRAASCPRRPPARSSASSCAPQRAALSPGKPWCAARPARVQNASGLKIKSVQRTRTQRTKEHP